MEAKIMGNVISLDAFRHRGEVGAFQEESEPDTQQAARPSYGKIISGIQFVNCEETFDADTLCVERFFDPRDGRYKMRVMIETDDAIDDITLDATRPTGLVKVRFGVITPSYRPPWVVVKVACETRMYHDGSLRHLFIFTIPTIEEDRLVICWHRNDGQKTAICFCC